MNPLAILSLLSDLYQQIQTQQQRIAELEAKDAEKQNAPPPA